MLKPIDKIRLDFSFDKTLFKKIYLMCQRVEQKTPASDCHIIISGDEGIGKSTLSGGIGYIVSQVTGRKFSSKNFFFDYTEMLKFAQSTESQIIISDEPALEGLASQWWKESQQNWLKFLMIGRKKRHFIISNMTKFWKFPEYILTDRSIALIHVYSRDNKADVRFLYIPKKNLVYLYNDYQRKKQRNYAKYHQFHGTFSDVLDKVIDIKDYNQRKENAIMSIGNVSKNDEYRMEAKYLKYLLSQLSPYRFHYKSRLDIEKQLKLPPNTLDHWAEAHKNTPIPKSFEEKMARLPQNINYKGIIPPTNDNSDNIPGEKIEDNLDKKSFYFSEKNSNNNFIDGENKDINKVDV